MSWLRFASDWRDGPLQRWPWLPWAGLLVLALAALLIGAYENDWWIIHQPPHVPPARPHQTLTHEEFWEQADREYHERLRRGR